MIHDEHDDFGQGLWQLLNSEERKEFVIMETYRDLGFPKVPWNEDYRFVYHHNKIFEADINTPYIKSIVEFRDKDSYSLKEEFLKKVNNGRTLRQAVQEIKKEYGMDSVKAITISRKNIAKYSYAGDHSNTADPVTYDDEGKVITLSQRFDSAKRDIRRSGKVGEPVTSINEEKMQDSEGDGYSEYDKPITIHDVEVLRSIRKKSINAFTSDDIKIAQKWAYKFYKELGVKSPFFRAWFGDWREFDVSPVELVSFSYGESPKINYNERSIYNRDMKRK